MPTLNRLCVTGPPQKGAARLHKPKAERRTNELVRQNIQAALLLHLAGLPGERSRMLACFCQRLCRRRCLHVSLFLRVTITLSCLRLLSPLSEHAVFGVGAER